ncbi:MAG: hypothetical protein Kow0010_25360 [Dehalococcoidia bacterium]
MAVSVLVPKLADDASGGVLVAWYCDEGAEVSAGDLIACLERDHVAFDIEAETGGILYRGLAVGDHGFAGDLVAYIVPAVAAGADRAPQAPDDAAAAAVEPPREPIPFPGPHHHIEDSAAMESAAKWEAAAGESDKPFAWSSDVEDDGEGVIAAADGAEDSPVANALFDEAEVAEPATVAGLGDVGASDPPTSADELAWGLLTPEEAAEPFDTDEEDAWAVEDDVPLASDVTDAGRDVEALEAELVAVEEPAFETYAPEFEAFGDSDDEGDEDSGYEVALPDEPEAEAAEQVPSFLSAFEEEDEPADVASEPDGAWQEAVSFIEEVSPGEPVFEHVADDVNSMKDELDADGTIEAAWSTEDDVEDVIPEDEDAYVFGGPDAMGSAGAGGEAGDLEVEPVAPWPGEGLAPFVGAPAVRNMRVEVDLTAAADAFGGQSGRSAEDVLARAVAIALAAYEGFEEAGDAIQVVVAGEEPAEEEDRPTTCRITSFAPYGIHAADAPVPDGHAFAFAMGAVRETVAFQEKALVPVRFVTVSLAYDPGVVPDGDAAGLLARVRELLEAPGELMAA